MARCHLTNEEVSDRLIEISVEFFHEEDSITELELGETIAEICELYQWMSNWGQPKRLKRVA